MYAYSNHLDLPWKAAELREMGEFTSVEREIPNKRKWSRLSKEDQESVVDAYQAGEASTSLASRFGVSKSVVLSVLRAHGVKLRRRSMTKADIRFARKLYESGKPLSYLAKEMSFNQETIRLALIRAGVQLRPATRASSKN